MRRVLVVGIVSAGLTVPSAAVAYAATPVPMVRSALAGQGNTQFGIKCLSGTGPVATGCRDYRTDECGPGGCASGTVGFRVYRDLADSFRDHDRFLLMNSRYAGALAVRGDPNA